MTILVSNASPDPIYEQIAKQIKGHIIAGTLEEGEPLPSIRKLAQEIQVSVITTKRAYEDLEREGFIDTVAGKGTFVAAQNDEFLREKKVREIERALGEAVSRAKTYRVEESTLHEIISLLYGEE